MSPAEQWRANVVEISSGSGLCAHCVQPAVWGGMQKVISSLHWCLMAAEIIW
jgi:hypothetical protein